MEEEPGRAVEGVAPDELEQVAEHLDDPVPDTAPRAVKPGGPLRFARMTGSSIAGRDAAGWMTDFLNAAYYRRPVSEREVDDLRLAFATLGDRLADQVRLEENELFPLIERTMPEPALADLGERLRDRDGE